jgi:hypothetical protein
VGSWASPGNIAFTPARAYAHPREAIAVAPDYVAVAIEIEQIDDRQARFVVERGSIALRR